MMSFFKEFSYEFFFYKCQSKNVCLVKKKLFLVIVFFFFNKAPHKFFMKKLKKKMSVFLIILNLHNTLCESLIFNLSKFQE